MEENEIYEALGVPPQEPEEGPEPNRGEPVDGGEIPEEGSGGQEHTVEEPQSPEEPLEQPIPQTHVENQAERERRMAEELDKVYAQVYAGQVNPFTGEPIRSKADHDTYQRQMAEDAQRQAIERLQAAGVAAEDIKLLVNAHPAVQRAEQLAAVAQAQQEEAQRTQARAWFDGQLKEIAALDPEIMTLEALQAHDPKQYTALMDMVSRGVSLVQAYKSLNFDVLMQRRMAAAEQQERNRAAGKAHLLPSKGKGPEAVEVPDAVRAKYLDMMPDMTDKEISEAYANYLKTTKKREE